MNRKLTIAVAATLSVLALRAVGAQEPCCGVVSVDVRTDVVTGKEIKGAGVYEVKIDNAILLRKVRVGDKVDVDVRSGKAKIVGISGGWAVRAASFIVGRTPNTYYRYQ